jgi:Ca2+-binding EF-hand superfamily protein
MKKNKALLAMLSVTSLFFATVDVSMAEEQPGPPPSFEQLDTNHDGQLSKDELKGPLLDDFDRFDTDGSGTLSEDEMPEPPAKK